jgi:CRISPR/Cas system-associated exonuclease Cas4 (RecB family)
MLKELEENQELLRFDKKYVIVSEIADQYYCEKKVDLKNVHGDIDTESKILGRELHEVITEGFEQVRLKERWEVTFKSKLVLISESLFVAKVDDIYFLFKPDGILFEHGIPRLLIEFKFSKYQKPFLSYHVQLRTEALIDEREAQLPNNKNKCRSCVFNNFCIIN